MLSDDFTVIDTSIIQSIRNLDALGMYAYLKMIGGNSTINDINSNRKITTKNLNKAINRLLELGLITINQSSPTLEYTGENLITIIK